MLITKCKKVFIILGDDCNLSCRYCIQHPITHRQHSPELNMEVLKWLDETACNADEPLNVCFYGGEPLLYYETIKKIVGFHKRGPMKFYIITNGRALTDEMVSFFNSHNVHVTVSWDGPHVKETRGYDVMDPKTGNRHLLLSLNELCLTAVVSAKNYPLDILKAMQEIDDEFYEMHHRHISVNLDYIFGCNLPDPSLFDIDYGKISAQMQAILDEYDSWVHGGYADPCIIQWVSKYLNIYLYSLRHDVDPYCQNGRAIMNVDTSGNLYLCHNTREIIGTIHSRPERYFARVDALEQNMPIQKEQCSVCPGKKLCLICCKLIPQDKVEDYYCKLRRAVFQPIVEYIEIKLASEKGE